MSLASLSPLCTRALVTDLSEPDTPTESEYNCADSVHEEVLLTHFDNIAPAASNGGMASIEITSDNLRDFREKMGEATHGRVISSAEAREMLQEVDMNSDGTVTAAEFVTYECAALYDGDASVGAGNTCQWLGDGICDEPTLCARGTDVVDCTYDAQVLPCDYTSDGVCDEGTYCAYGTDTVDCAVANTSEIKSTVDGGLEEDSNTPLSSADDSGGAAMNVPNLQTLALVVVLAIAWVGEVEMSA